MVPLPHYRGKVTDETLGFIRRTGSEEVEHGDIGRGGDRKIIHVYYLEKRLTINADYYATLLHSFSHEIKKKYAFRQEESALPPSQYTDAISTEKIVKLKLELLTDSSNSPYFASCEFVFILTRKNVLLEIIHDERDYCRNKLPF